jgi:Ohr subfamily peroxiredoxin
LPKEFGVKGKKKKKKPHRTGVNIWQQFFSLTQPPFFFTSRIASLPFEPPSTIIGGPGTNPEELFASGYAACFGGALAVAAQELKVKLSPDTAITGRVHIGKKSKGFQLGVELTVTKSGISDADWDKVIKTTHEICPYSHAVHGNSEVKTIKGEK